MNTRRSYIQVLDQSIEVVYKGIKNLHLSVNPPQGKVRVAAPLRLNDDAVRLAVASRMGWIRRRQRQFAEQDRQSEREMVTGESHYFLGGRYRLTVIEARRSSVRISRPGRLELLVRSGSDRATRARVLREWYREQLKAMLPGLVDKWESAMGVSPSSVSVKRMKTRWGTCTDSGRIWLNLELVKKPPLCLEYVFVHEMAHLLERRHNERFVALMDTCMPLWRTHRDELNRAPLAHEDWSY